MSLRHLTQTRATVVAIAGGMLLVLWNDQLARVLARLLPWRGEVKSAGTFFPAFPDAAPIIISRSGWMLMVLPLLTALTVRAQHRVRTRPGVDGVAAATVVGGTALWFGWLATPHNAFPSNARIHWVDYLTFRQDRLFYAAGRIPHELFYDSPPTWQALNAALVAGLAILIARRLGFSLLASSVLALVVSTAGNLLRFANSAEDVFVNIGLVMLVVYASLVRRSVLFGLSLALLLTGRPQFIVIFPAVVLAEFLVAARARRYPTRDEVRYVATALSVAIAGVVFTQVVFEVVGERYFFHNGQLVDIGTLESVRPRRIDGFTISAFSGTYVLHLLWVLPIALIGCACLAVVRAPRLSTGREASVYFWACSFVSLVALHEAQPLLYFNIRYLTYAFPFLVSLVWAFVRTMLEERGPEPEGKETKVDRQRWIAVGSFWLVVIAPITIPGDAVQLKRTLEDRAVVELLAVSDDLRSLADGRVVFLDSSSNGMRNYVAYVLRAPVGEVRLLSEDDYEPGGIVIGFSDDPWSDVAPVLATERLEVYDPNR